MLTKLDTKQQKKFRTLKNDTINNTVIYICVTLNFRNFFCLCLAKRNLVGVADVIR